MRYKILTNFVNAYKDKMFLSNSPGKDEGIRDIMTMKDLMAHKQAEQSDIKLDFEQFMRIFSVEKTRSSNVDTGNMVQQVTKKQAMTKDSSRKSFSPTRTTDKRDLSLAGNKSGGKHREDLSSFQQY